MVDVPEGEIPQLVRPEKKPFMDGETPPHSPEQVVAVAKVFDDDDLLREIIVRVGFPTTLVRAALVCKRWLEHASDPKFLSHFRKLHPPRLLGFYITHGSAVPRFVPMLPQPPELTTVMRRLESFSFGAYKIVCCQNGSFFTTCRIEGKHTYGVHRPLCAEKGMGIVPPLPPTQDINHQHLRVLVSKEEGSSVSYLHLLAERSMARVYTMQDGGWHMHTSAACLPSLHDDGSRARALLVDNKIHMLFSSADHINILDLISSSFSTIQLPQGVKYHHFKSRLSRADDASSVYLIHVEEFQLRVWLHKGDNWLLVDTICLLEMLATLGISDHTLENEGIAGVLINQVGDIGQCVFLRMGKYIFYLDIKCRTMCKVYESTVKDLHCCSIHPFMMIWPPTFPAIKDNAARNAM